MAPERYQRKLTAILSADVAGYSRLMGDDEASTVETLNIYKEIMAALVQQHRGRVVDFTGDNLLAEFASVVDAVQCGVAVQKELQARNAELPDNRKMEFRIGINLGDVIQEDDRIYGDGVNVAARLEAIANPGGICVSKTAFDQIESKLPLGYEYLGDQTVKNIAKPVGAYRVLMEPRITVAGAGDVKKGPVTRKRSVLIGAFAILLLSIGLGIWYFYFRPSFEPASVDKMAHPLPEKPSIAVLPFKNLSGDPSQDFISDGISENIISALSKIGEIFVIAKDSTFVFKGKVIKLKQIAEELGVRYLLEGSVQKSGERIRATVQLVDALSGHQLWSEKYDREVKNLFQIQDDITHKIVVAMQVKLTHGQQVQAWYGTTSFEAWGYTTKGVSLFEQFNKADNAKARELFNQAVKIDPKYAFAWIMLSWTYAMDVRMGFRNSDSESLSEAVKLAKKAFSIDDSIPDVHALLNTIYLIQRKYDEAIAAGRKSIELGPNSAWSHVLLAQTLFYAGKFEEAVVFAEQSVRLSPYPPMWHLVWWGFCYRHAERFQDALEVFNKFFDRAQKGEYSLATAHSLLAITYAMMGQHDKARIHWEEMLRLDPNYLKFLRVFYSYFKDPNQLDRMIDALRNAGLLEKEVPPLPDKPSIAVLPFDNLSGDPKQELFSDGLAENIITQLAKIPTLLVIARNSSFTYKGKSVTVQKVGKELGVRYVLEGSVQKAENRLRVTAKLVDTKTGIHLWAQAYDRELQDFFQLQDEITLMVVNALQVKLTGGEKDYVLRNRTNNLKAWAVYMNAYKHFQKFTKEDNARAIELCKKAIDLDSNYSSAYAGAAWSYLIDYRYGWNSDRGHSLRMAEQFAKKCIAKDDTNPLGHAAMSYVYGHKKQLDNALAEAERAIELGPNDMGIISVYSHTRFWIGKYDEGLKMMKKAIRVHPLPPPYILGYAGMGYYYTGQYKEAIEILTSSLKRFPRHNSPRLWLIATYVALGKEREAHEEVKKLLEINPQFSANTWAIGYFASYKDSKMRDHILKQFAKVGLN